MSPRDGLAYWNAGPQEAYASAECMARRWVETRKAEI